MTVTELEQWVTEAKHVKITYEVSDALVFHDNDTSWVKDLIADWRLMRERLEGFRNGDMYIEIAAQAEDTLADLRLEP